MNGDEQEGLLINIAGCRNDDSRVVVDFYDCGKFFYSSFFLKDLEHLAAGLAGLMGDADLGRLLARDYVHLFDEHDIALSCHIGKMASESVRLYVLSRG